MAAAPAGRRAAARPAQPGRPSPFHGELDEPLETFPPELDAWHQEDLVSTAGLARGLVLGLVLAPLCWLLPLAIWLGMYVLLR